MKIDAVGGRTLPRQGVRSESAAASILITPRQSENPAAFYAKKRMVSARCIGSERSDPKPDNQVPLVRMMAEGNGGSIPPASTTARRIGIQAGLISRFSVVRFHPLPPSFR